MIPGSNLLLSALSVIAPQVVSYQQYTGRVLNSNGLYENTYDITVNLSGSFQPVPRNLYAQFGLNLEKRYALFYTLSDLLSVERGNSGDLISFSGITYQCEANNEWYQIDGWNGVLLSAIAT